MENVCFTILKLQSVGYINLQWLSMNSTHLKSCWIDGLNVHRATPTSQHYIIVTELSTVEEISLFLVRVKVQCPVKLTTGEIPELKGIVLQPGCCQDFPILQK